MFRNIIRWLSHTYAGAIRPKKKFAGYVNMEKLLQARAKSQSRPHQIENTWVFFIDFPAISHLWTRVPVFSIWWTPDRNGAKILKDPS